MRTYTLEDAAKAFPEFSVTDLRNYIKRRLLCCVGDVPLAGQPRRFNVYGMYEIGLLHALYRKGLDLGFASAVLGPFISQEAIIAGMKAIHSGSEIKASYSIESDLPLTSRLSHSDLAFPILLLFARDRGGLIVTNLAEGWDDLQFAVARLYHRYVTLSYMPSFYAAHAAAEVMPTPTPDDIRRAETELPLFYTLNLTSTCLDIRKAIEG